MLPDQREEDLRLLGSALSHDVEGSVRGVKSLASILLSRHAAPMDEDGRAMLRLLGSEVDRASRLLDGLMDWLTFAQQPLQFGAGRQQGVASIQLMDEVRDTPQQGLQAFRPRVVVELFMIGHRLPSPDARASSQVYGGEMYIARPLHGQKLPKSRRRSSLGPFDSD